MPLLSSPSPTGLNGVNLLIPAGQPPAGMGLNPTLAVPYVVLPSAALSHYPLVAGGLPQQLSDAQSSHNKLSFSLPSVMPPFMVGAVPYNIAAGSERSSVPSPATPEHSRVQGSLTGTPNSPSGPHQTVNISTPEPLVGRFPLTANTFIDYCTSNNYSSSFKNKTIIDSKM